MRYLSKSFSVGGHTKSYSAAWDRIFGPSPLCQCGHVERDHTNQAGCTAVDGYGPDEKVCPCGQFVQVPE